MCLHPTARTRMLLTGCVCMFYIRARMSVPLLNSTRSLIVALVHKRFHNTGSLLISAPGFVFEQPAFWYIQCTLATKKCENVTRCGLLAYCIANGWENHNSFLGVVHWFLASVVNKDHYQYGLKTSTSQSMNTGTVMYWKPTQVSLSFVLFRFVLKLF